MSDTTYNVFQHYGTNAERLAFVPNPAAAIKPLYIWYETDTNSVYIYTTAWNGPFNAVGGPLTLHAPTHSLGGTDPVDVTDLAGFTGLVTDFLKGDATFGSLPARISSLGLIIDGGITPIAVGLKGYLEIPFACTILAVTLLADQVGSIVFDIWKDIYGSFPPTVADTITAAAKPTISAANKSQDTTLVGWNTAIAAGDILAFNVDSVATIQKVTLSLKVQVT
jgi:hypothetical protein